VYRTWSAHLPADVEVCAIQLPGREGRYAEAPFTDVHALTPVLCDALADLLDRPFAFFGHSLGALVAYEAALAIARKQGLTPAVLFVSGRRAPQLPLDRAPIHHLPQAAFIEELRQMNGTPAEVFANAELLDIVLPVLRADFQMAETYRPSGAGTLACPVVALGSTGDDRVSVAGLEPWREVTTSPFELVMLPGDHFYLRAHAAALLAVLTTHLGRVAR
jgi:medium-chain acyl-[acyl-carrier-protein] hydrolase